MAVLGFFIVLPAQLQLNEQGYISTEMLILGCLGLVTITVPPALPTSLAIGVSYALSRL